MLKFIREIGFRGKFLGPRREGSVVEERQMLASKGRIDKYTEIVYI